MPVVKGIGGVFIESHDAKRLARWYHEILGIETEAHPNGIGYYKVFNTRDPETSVMRENPVFAINHAKGELAKSGRGYQIGFRVDALMPFLDALRAKGIEVEPELLEWKHGKHGWVRDPDGNRVELYEEIL